MSRRLDLSVEKRGAHSISQRRDAALIDHKVDASAEARGIADRRGVGGTDHHQPGVAGRAQRHRDRGAEVAHPRGGREVDVLVEDDDVWRERQDLLWR